MTQMDPRDSVFLYSEGGNVKQANMTAYVFANSGDGPGRDEIVEWIAERAPKLDVLRRRLVRVPLDLGYPHWVESPTFDVEEHIHFHHGSGWAELRILIAELMQRPMDLSRPPWELHVATGVRGIAGVPGSATVVAVRTHHCAADGTLSAEIARHLFGAGTAASVEPRSVVTPLPSRARLLAVSVLAVPRSLWDLAGGLRSARSAKRRLHAEYRRGQYRPPVARRPRTQFNLPLGPRRVFDSITLPLGELREVKSDLGAVTINDLAMAVIGGALRAYLPDAGSPPVGSLAAAVPVTTRGKLAGTSRNQFGLMTVDLHTDIADPVARVRAIHESSAAERARVNGPEVRELDGLARAVPSIVLKAVLRCGAAWPDRRSETVGLANTLISNVPKGAADLRLCDSTVAVTYGLVPLIGRGGLAHRVDSIGDVLTINITVDPDQVPDDDRYAELLRRSFADLRDAAQAAAEARVGSRA
ncbi:wax ester/triacylglycerol synthase domain-containing protein [Rhodococcus kronopolitis]|uniref:diacylglycerol O-acyltransferase n=1 Tax=Rhodococcus kronopolitis TaxID=1460226 RepID=A0ABV9FS36_9NOCA